jgi:hypothetical protein
MNDFLLTDISNTENELAANAQKEYGKYYDHAQYAVSFFHSFIKSAAYEGVFFSMFHASAEKHIVVGALSGIRLHHVQATLDFRYAAEAGCWAAYALAHPDPDRFAEKRDDGTIEPTKKLKEEMYKWIEEKYPSGNDSIKKFKDSLNKLSTHANIVDAHRNFGEFGKENISTSFFDNSEEHHVKTDLWTAANLVMGLLDIFYGVNRDYPILVLQDDFLYRMKILKQTNNELKAEMMQHPRLKRFAS